MDRALRIAGVTLVVLVFWFAAALPLGYVLGLRVNRTPSMPLGLYREVREPVAVGSTVRTCLPLAVEAVGVERGYLSRGGCPGGGVPVLKRVVGLGGARFRIDSAGVFVSGHQVAGPPRARDYAKRVLTRFSASGVVPVGQAFLVGDSSDSWDSRYYGPVPLAGLVAVRVLIVTGANEPANRFFAHWRPG